MKTLFFIFLSIFLTVNAFAVGGGVVGDGTRMVTLPSGEIVPEDFILEFQDEKLSLKPVILEEDFSDVYKELKKFGQLIQVRQFHPSFKKEEFLPINDLRRSGLMFYLVDEVNKVKCGRDLDACAYKLQTYNASSYKFEYVSVIELKRKTMTNPKISARKKALIVLHEMLHHDDTILRLAPDYKNEVHRLISPFVTKLNILENAYAKQKALFAKSNEMYQLTDEEYEASVEFQKILSILGYDNENPRAGEKCATTISRLGGGVNILCTDTIEMNENNYVSIDSEVSFHDNSPRLNKKLEFNDNMVIDSIINSYGAVALNDSIIKNSNIVIAAGRFVNMSSSKIFKSDIRLYESTFNQANILNTIIKHGYITCDGCTIKNSKVENTSLSGKWNFVIDSVVIDLIVKNTNFINTKWNRVKLFSEELSDKGEIITFDNCTLQNKEFRLQTIINKAKEAIVVKNWNMDMNTFVDGELLIDKNAESEIAFDLSKTYVISGIYKKDGKRVPKLPVLKSVYQFEKDYPQFIKQK